MVVRTRSCIPYSRRGRAWVYKNTIRSYDLFVRLIYINRQQMSRGVLYIASGSRYIEQAKKSAKSLKRHNPSLSTTLYTDENIEISTFDQIIPLEKQIVRPGDSILSKKHFPYEYNLYLDTDTYVCGNICDIYDILSVSDIAVAHNNTRTQWTKEIYKENDVDLPSAFTEYNSGVIAYKDCMNVRKTFDEWNAKYRTLECDYNQPALRLALYSNDIDISTLPPEYNFMNHRVGYACGKIKIIHKTSPHLTRSQISKLLNNNKEPRVVTWDDYPFRVVPDSYQSRRYRLKDLMQSIKRKQRSDGAVSLIKAVINRLFRR